jgi:DNA repair protein SbcD/Mre11
MTDRKPRLRLLHTSDVHLGAYDSTSAMTERAEAKRAALEHHFASVIDVAISEQVDLVLIAGDFFDNARVLPDTLEFAAHQLARLDCHALILPGNHDHVGPGSIYDRFDLTAIAQNLRILRAPGGETAAYEALDLEVWGRSHTELEPDFSPFEDAPPRGAALWQIGIGHGHFIHPLASTHHSFHIREEHLATSARDYVALGHWERMYRVAAGEGTVAAYSGAPEGLGTDNGGHVLLVDLLENGAVRLTGHPLHEAPPIPHDDIPHLEGV